MKTMLKTGPAITGLITLCAVAAAILTLAPATPVPETRIPTQAMAAPAEEMVEVRLADVIAAQGNAALKQIRAEAVVLPPPDLSTVAIGHADE